MSMAFGNSITPTDWPVRKGNQMQHHLKAVNRCLSASKQMKFNSPSLGFLSGFIQVASLNFLCSQLDTQKVSQAWEEDLLMDHEPGALNTQPISQAGNKVSVCFQLHLYLLNVDSLMLVVVEHACLDCCSFFASIEEHCKNHSWGVLYCLLNTVSVVVDFEEDRWCSQSVKLFMSILSCAKK